jgi:hypothetical protein
MRVRWGRFLPLCLLAVTACAPLGPGPSREDVLMTAFDVQEWTVAHQSANQRERIMEFVPPGHKITAWTELMTLHTLRRPPGPPDVDGLAAAAFEPLSKRCPGRVTWNVIRRWMRTETEEASMLYEWTVKDCPPEADQHEVARIVYGKFSIFRLAYTAKTGELEPVKRDKWIRELSGATVVSGK